MRKRKKNNPAMIDSADEAERQLTPGVYYSADDLRDLVRKIWEDGYATGISEARSTAAIEAAEAEWFGG